MSPGPRAGAAYRYLSSTEQWWRPRTFNSNYVCAAENYSPRAFAACCDGPVTNSVVPIEAKAAVSPGGVCAAYCYVDDTRMASNDRNPRGYSDYYMCLVEMSGERGRSGLKTVHGEWITVNGERGSTGDEDAGARHRDHHKHQIPIPAPVPLDLDSDTGELIFPSPYAYPNDDNDDERRRRSTTDETLGPVADSGSSIKHKTEDLSGTSLDPKLANPDDAAQNNQTIAPDRPLSYSYTYSTTSTSLANPISATPTIETGFTVAPGPSGGVTTTSMSPTQTGTETEAPNAGQPTSTSAAAAIAGRLKHRSGAWGVGKWGCFVAALVGGWAVC